jgi:hypothetical protein
VIPRERASFFADRLVNINPGPADLVDIAILTADLTCGLDIEPHIAMISVSDYGQPLVGLPTSRLVCWASATVFPCVRMCLRQDWEANL